MTLAGRERLEWLAVVLLAALAAASLPLQADALGWSWDALNHHIYLGFIAQHPRWQLDVHAASTQSFQYPYLYWPAYLLSQWPGRPATGAALWSAFQAAMVAAPIWLASRRLLPAQDGWLQAMAWRAAACVAAFLSGAVLASLETTANDMLAAVPMLWAIAVGLHPDFDDRRAALASALVGVAVAFKWSNGLYLPWVLFWWLGRSPAGTRLRRGAVMALAVAAGFVLAYGPWGWQLWAVWRNPFYPMFDTWFRAG